MPSQHKAVYLEKVGVPFSIGAIDTKSPAKGEVCIRVHALAINPVDWKIQDSGYPTNSWPIILGEDVAGTIEAVGDGVTRFKSGQRVLAHAQYLMTKKLEHSGFQELVLAPETSVVPIPEGMKFEDASVLPLAMSTAAAGLYQPKSEMFLELPLPSTKPQKTGKTLLVWGGSASVGTAVIQLAVASGLAVAATCSKRNFELVEKLGAKAFDYNSPSVVGDLVAELQRGEFVGGYDAIGSRESSMQSAQVIAQLGGGILANVLNPPEDIPATVQSKMVLAPTIFYGSTAYVGKGVYEDFLPQALASGQIVPAPDSEVTGNGLGAVEAACQRQKAGVSGKKIVVTL